MDPIDQLRSDYEDFVRDRDWEQFHSPKNLAMALSVEASEIVEIFQWMNGAESYDLEDEKLQHLREEIGDVLLYLLLLASKYDVDPISAARQKLEHNDQKYPVDKAKGTAKKYTEL